MLVLLPDIMASQENANTDNKMKALLVFRNVLGHMSREEASLTALQLVEKLLPLFDDESSQLRELSICLFRDVIQMVVGKDKKQMEENVRRSLLPLFFRMSDQSESVAKASQEALLVAAKLLKWRQLTHLTQTQQTCRIGECLLVQDRSRVEEYLSQSLPYLKDAQVPLREAAVRFIGEPQPLGSLFWLPGPSPSRCTGSKGQPCGCQSPGCPVQGVGSQGLCASLSQPCPRRWAWWLPRSVPPRLGYCPSLGSPC
ncbi:maestro heat-like repeat-containing protein family member 7 isoform 1-T1 [Theristicus caerulescens]